MKQKKQIWITIIYMLTILFVVVGNVLFWIHLSQNYDDGNECIFLHDKVNIGDNVVSVSLVIAIIFMIFVIICMINILLIMIWQLRNNKSKEEYINSIVHDFRTSITTINLGCQVLRETEERPIDTDVDYLMMINDEANRMNFMTEKILNFMQTKENVISDNVIDVHEVIKNVINSMNIIISSSKSVVIENLKASFCFIKGDKSSLKSVFFNLIDNAIKYNDSDPIITINTYNENRKLIIEIKDNGIGLSQEDSRKIFRRAYRVSSKDTIQISGFGLGLYNVKRIIDELSGNIFVDSQLGRGSSFIISLPYNKPP